MFATVYSKRQSKQKKRETHEAYRDKRMHFRNRLLLFLTVFSLSYPATSQQAIIDGHVFDNTGHPVSGAHIALFPLEAAFSGGMPFAVTDANGSYALASPAYGKTRVLVIKEDAGYPDTSAVVFAPKDDALPIVMLADGVHLHEINIQLPSPDGTIEGQIVNKATGERIASARITLDLPENPDMMYATGLRGGTYFFALPDKKIEITITAAGFKPFRIVTPTTGKSYVELRSFDHLKIDAALEPLH